MTLFLEGVILIVWHKAIYATFQEAFPESSELFNDEFKENLGSNIFLWLSGMNMSFTY